MKLKPCYRCMADAKVEFSGLPYCRICFSVVVAMWPAVQHDPPVGFPGGAPAAGWAEKVLEEAN